MKTTLNIIAVIFLVGCGIQEEDADLLKQKDSSIKEEKETTQKEEETISLRGYVSAAFAITVDGELYSDSEDFYSQQVDSLHAEMIEDGYKGYDLYLDAQLGLKDLKRNMRVYAVSEGDEGYAAEEVIDYEGKFSIKFPSDAKGSDLLIRANKRIGVRLVKGDETIRWCYNFSARKEVVLGDKPIILRDFFTKLTKYKCKAESGNDTLRIPGLPGVFVKEAFEANEEDIGYGPYKGDKESSEPDVKAVKEDIEEIINEVEEDIEEGLNSPKDFAKEEDQ